MKIIAILLALTPSFIHVNIRRLMGASIGRGSRIKFGSIVLAKKIKIDSRVKIGPFSYISCNELSIGNHSRIKPLSAVSSRIIKLGKYVHISPLSIITSDHSERAIFTVGDHSRFFPFCWLEPGEGIEIGNNVGIGGHSLVFTHGVWPDYIDGGPVAFGPVKIEDNVWLPWRVFIMPGVVIGKNAVIGANSTVTRSVPENVVAAGSPAKVVKENTAGELSSEDKTSRMMRVLTDFAEDQNFRNNNTSSTIENHLLRTPFGCISIDDSSDLKAGDLLFLVNNRISDVEIKALNEKKISVISHYDKNIHIVGKNKINSSFISFIRKYGIRLNTN